MKQRPDRLQRLLKVVEKQQHEALRELDVLQSGVQMRETLLAQLDGYLNEYLQRGSIGKAGHYNPHETVNYHAFVKQVFEARIEGVQILTRMQEGRDACQRDVEELGQRRNAVREVIKRIIAGELQTEGRRQQKSADEFATRMAVRRDR